MNKTLIIYHRVDYDGIFGGLVAYNFYKNVGDVNLLGFNYGDKLPDIGDIILNYTTICMVDISFPVPEMIRLKESGKLVWVDHHENIIKELGFSEDDVPGKRAQGKGACELMWEFAIGDIEAPKLIQLISAYDVWDHKRFDWENEVLPIQNALKAHFGTSIDLVLKEFNNNCSTFEIDKLMEEGKIIQKYLQIQYSGWCKTYSFPVQVDGKYSGICMLSPLFSALQFKRVENKYDIYLIVNRSGDGIYKVGIYKNESRALDFDCAKYAHDVYKTGNGHKCAAGFTINDEQFMNLVVNKKI